MTKKLDVPAAVLVMVGSLNWGSVAVARRDLLEGIPSLMECHAGHGRRAIDNRQRK